MDLPFKVKITHDNKIEELKFVEIEHRDSIDIKWAPTIKEFHTVSFNFISEDQSDKLFIKELDDFKIEGRIDSEEGSYYFQPLNDEIFIFNISEKKDVPLVPGFYYFHVEHHKNTYCSLINIVPKDLTTSEWEKMREEIEATVRGLSTEFIKRSGVTGINNNSNNEHSVMLLEKIDQFYEDIPKLLSSLEKIKNETKFKISKNYTWKPNGSKAIIDCKTIQMMQIHPEKKDWLYSPQRYLEYDISENQWIKFILQDFKSFSKKSIDFLCKIEEERSQEVRKESKYSFYRTSASNSFREKRHKSFLFEKQEEIKRLSSFNNYIEDFLRSDSMNKISDKKPRFIPKSLILAPHYNKVYKAYLMLHDKKDILKLDKQYRYFWRSTELLYEIWTYIKTIEALRIKGFEPISGWIFNTSEYAEILPFLKDGTKVTLRKDDIKINLVFNEKLETKLFKNTLESPLKTYSNRNKPDIRIDIFMTESSSYIGSIILDAKYKRLHNIINSHYGYKQLTQLRDYRNAASSSIIDFEKIIVKQIKSVQAVFAVYPIKDKESNKEKSFDEENILFSELRPKKGISHFSHKLISQIEERITIWKGYNKYRKD